MGVVVMAGTLLMAACAGKGTTTSTGSGGSSQGASTTVETQQVPNLGAVVASSSGLTLYHLKTETNGKIECTGSCVSVWPPLLAPSNGNATKGTGLSGKLGTVTRPDGGVQLTYDGMPLYEYSGDSSAGQANGQGFEGKWFAITPSGALAGGSAGGSVATSPSGGGYSYH